MKILIDNGHGIETPGKRSPDGRLLEWKYTRELARKLHQAVIDKGGDAVLLVPEDYDVPLHERVKRANQYSQTCDCVLISLHVNAAGIGQKWMEARGWGAYVSQNASQKSMALATSLTKSAMAHGLKVRYPSPQQLFWKQSLAICRDTLCPAVLTENLFMDNYDDCSWLLSLSALDILTKIHLSPLTPNP